MNVFLVPVRECHSPGELTQYWHDDGKFLILTSEHDVFRMGDMVKRSQVLPAVSAAAAAAGHDVVWRIWTTYTNGRKGSQQYRLLCQRKGGGKACYN